MERKIAIPVDENGILEGHFGHCRKFAFYTLANNNIVSEEFITPPPHEPGVLPKWLVKNNVTDLLASGMGERAQKILTHFNLNVFLGSPKIKADELVKNFITGGIVFNPETCNHHEHEHEHEHKHYHHHNHIRGEN